MPNGLTRASPFQGSYDTVDLMNWTPRDASRAIKCSLERKGSEHMITLDLRHQQITLEELFRVARSESVLIVTDEGQEYILEAADEFDREVAELGRSEKFMDFLAERRKESGRIPLEEIERRLKPLEGE